MRCVKNTPDKNLVRVFVLVWGLILTFGVGLLPAQQPPPNLSSDQPTGSRDDENVSAPRASSDNADVPSPETLTFAARLKDYERSFLSPDALIGPALGAGIGQRSNSPPEWGQGAAGFGRRLASGYGRSAIGHSIRFGVSAIDHEDTRFVPSNENGIWRRTQHAVKGVFVSRTDSGGAMPAFSRFAEAYGSGFLANLWEPPSQDTAGHALKRGSTSLSVSVAWHVFMEFAPDIRNALHRKRN